jgi:hypothetical protein
VRKKEGSTEGKGIKRECRRREGGEEGGKKGRKGRE